MHSPRGIVSLLGMVSAVSLLTGCTVVAAPRPIETRLPPGFDGRSVTSPAPSSTPVMEASIAPTADATPTDDATPTGGASPRADALSCGEGGNQAVSGAEQTFRITGTCEEVTIAGSGITVDGSSATVGTLRISGDRIRVQIASGDAVVVQGNDGTVTSAAGIGRVEISGDRTTTEAAAAISSVTLRGQDNVVRSGSGVGSVVVEGSGNSIR